MTDPALAAIARMTPTERRAVEAALRAELAARTEYEFRGGNLALVESVENEAMLAGPSETGKTVAACFKLHQIARRYNKANCAIVRKTRASMDGTVLRTFGRVGRNRGYTTLGGDKPIKFSYANGSTIWIYGMDNPDRLLSAEFDAVYVNQSEELSENDWEMLATRTTGRAGIVEHPQLFGDCNPSGSRHWIRTRKSLRLLNSRHQDNPSLYDAAGALTAEGQKRMSNLSAALTGIRRKRLLEGIWATAEGAVYDTFDPTPGGPHVHARKREEMKRFFLAIDDGYTNPAVILDVGEDSDGRWHCFREFYQRGQARESIVKEAREWHREHRRDLVAVDNAVPELIEQFKAAGLPAVGAKGKVEDTIQLIRDRLTICGDGRPRYTVDPSCVNHINEFESYVYNPDTGKPIKDNDHSMDAVRYLAIALNEPSGAFSTAAGIRVGQDSPRVFVPDQIDLQELLNQ